MLFRSLVQHLLGRRLLEPGARGGRTVVRRRRRGGPGLDGPAATAPPSAPAAAGEVAQKLAGERPTRALLEEAGRLAAADARPISDTRGSADYRRSLVAVLTARALGDCCGQLGIGIETP